MLVVHVDVRVRPERVAEFLFIAAPLKIRGATGAPMRPLGLTWH